MWLLTTKKSAILKSIPFLLVDCVGRLAVAQRQPLSALDNINMLIKGEKYACEACVRGHRVSNCRHADRPLQHINKKVCPS
jgi:hypothetical protein